LKAVRTPTEDPQMTKLTTSTITIRPAYAEDESSLARLAALDSAERVPVRPLLLAEVDGELRLALSLRDGSAIADPFFPTVDLIALVQKHAAGITGRVAPRRRPRTYRLGVQHA
jgi:hypothetical protein